VLRRFAPDTDLRDAIERMIDREFEIHGDYQIVEKASTEPSTPTAIQPMPPVLVSVIAVYPDTAGRDAEEACRFAEALYRKDADRLGLPKPQAVIANLAEED
jgi:hypothetical protein